MSLLFMKFGTQNKSNMLIIKILFGIKDLDQKLQICETWSQLLGNTRTRCEIFSKLTTKTPERQRIYNPFKYL